MDAALGAAVLAGIPLPFAIGLDPSAINKQVQRTLSTALGDGQVQRALASAQCAEVRQRPVQPDKLQEALHKPGLVLSGSGRSGLPHAANP